jgi:hypothetical protein
MGSVLEKDMSKVADLQTHELPQGLLVTGHSGNESALEPVVKEALPHIHALLPPLRDAASPEGVGNDSIRDMGGILQSAAEEPKSRT